MKFSALKNYVFYPDINGNLELPESERLSFEIIRPTAEDHGTLVFTELVTKVGKDTKGQEIISTSSSTKFNTSKILYRHVGEIKNLVIEGADGSGKEKAITSGAELAAASFAGMNKLIDLVGVRVCSDKIAEAEKKISESGSA
jgi:cAMP phosphodiesterase